MSSDVVMVEPDEVTKKRLAELDSLRGYLDITYQKQIYSDWVDDWCRDIKKDIPTTSTSTSTVFSTNWWTKSDIHKILNLRKNTFTHQMCCELKMSFSMSQEMFNSDPIISSLTAIERLRHEVMDYLDSKVQEIERLK